MDMMTVTVRAKRGNGQWVELLEMASLRQIAITVHSTEASGSFRVVADGAGEVLVECSDSTGHAPGPTH